MSSVHGKVTKIDLVRIKERLFSDKATREKICKNYEIDTCPEDPESFAKSIVNVLGQISEDEPLELNHTNSDVFKAAVWAIGSNMRPWPVFLRSSAKLSELLQDYDPVKSLAAIEWNKALADQIAECLPGQSSRADTRAIIRWTKLLSEIDDFYGLIKELAHAFQELAEEKFSVSIKQPELFLCLVGYLSGPARKWDGLKYLHGRMPDGFEKLPGMGLALTSEFLRNLKWNGFKVDRHIKRLFERWFTGIVPLNSSKTDQLQYLIGRRNKDVCEFLQYSLIGIATSPEGVPLSEVDNLVWLLGSYVEKMGKESSVVYVTAR